jgi:hypothetical protein
MNSHFILLGGFGSISGKPKDEYAISEERQTLFSSPVGVS